MTQSGSVTPQGPIAQAGFVASPERIGARGGDLMVLRDKFGDIGRGAVDVAEGLPASAFGALPESTMAAEAHRACARAVQSGTVDTVGDLDYLAEAVHNAAEAYERNDSRGADRLR